jgi:NADH dehydrogenase/NADH:ubiquinone oxidoreductase subunit G
VTAKDNGGKQVSLALTYKKAISDITNNDVVLNIACKLAETMAVPYNRVTDAYGGYCGNPSPSLPAAAAKPAAAANATAANKTRLLANATANATVAKQTEWKINMFVQPDPFAEKADNDATAKAASGTAAQAAIDGVTKATYGAMTAVAKATTEAAVKWVKAPAATGGAKQVTIAGSTDVAAYVYCAVSKTASRRMLNATNATNATAAPAAKAAEVVNLQSAATAAKYHIQRQETATGKLAFSLAFSGLGEGKTYSWMCEATSLNPIAPAFRTAMSKGTAATSAAVVTSTGDSALWSSLFAAILMVAAVFFY